MVASTRDGASSPAPILPNRGDDRGSFVAMPLYVRTVLVTGSPAEVAQAASRHREQLRELHARGKLRLAGEFPDGEGFLEIFEAADLLEAESIARASALVEDGLGAWFLREWIELQP